MADLTAMLQAAAGAAVGEYQISRSLRFNSADSAYLERTPASAGDRETWTWSAWVKRGALGVEQALFSTNVSTADATNGIITFTSGDQLNFQAFNSVWRRTTQLFRDPSAWYHFVVVLDTTQATGSNRVKLYVNGVQITAFATSNDPTQNSNQGINQAAQHTIGRYDLAGGGGYFNGYMTEINFIDGQALTPTSFGEINEDTGVWSPIAYAGSYGTNGFYLNFSDNSGVTSTTLGKDQAGSNDWTPNNFSVTAGAGNDSLVDTPTRFGTDTGAGGEVRGNYCTWNPIDSGTTEVITNGNLDVKTNDSSVFTSTRASFGVSSGKWYWEVTCNAPSPTVADQIGIGTSTAAINSYFVISATGYGYKQDDGQKWNNNGGSSYGASYTTNDVIGVALNMDAGTLTFYKNGVSQGTAFSSLSGTFFPMIFIRDTTGSYSANFGQRPFEYTAPSGFKALVTTNLPDPTVVQGDEYFNTVLYTGTGSSLGVTGVGFQPDWVWIKERNGAANHGLYDAVRGVQNQLESNTTTAETTEATGLTAFGTDGFTVGALAQLNTSADTYVAWNWKANGAGVSNTAGTIASTVSANTDSGFSIVTYTGNNTASGTIGHGLGVAPSMIITKVRNTGSGWPTLVNTGSTIFYGLRLNSTGANDPLNGNVFYNSTPPTSTVYTVGDSDETNDNFNYVAYCFAEVEGFSKFGSYTGNGSADGPFVYTGFRPAFVMMKRTDSTANWSMFDTSRSSYNVMDDLLEATNSAAEGVYASYQIDFLSNGFKPRQNGNGINASGGTYIYMAFAENPVKFSLAR